MVNTLNTESSENSNLKKALVLISVGLLAFGISPFKIASLVIIYFGLNKLENTSLITTAKIISIAMIVFRVATLIISGFQLSKFVYFFRSIMNGIFRSNSANDFFDFFDKIPNFGLSYFNSSIGLTILQQLIPGIYTVMSYIFVLMIYKSVNKNKEILASEVIQVLLIICIALSMVTLIATTLSSIFSASMIDVTRNFYSQSGDLSTRITHELRFTSPVSNTLITAFAVIFFGTIEMNHYKLTSINAKNN